MNRKLEKLSFLILGFAFLSLIFFLPFVQVVVKEICECLFSKHYDLQHAKYVIATKEIFIFIALLCISVLLHFCNVVSAFNTFSEDEKIHVGTIFVFFLFLLLLHNYWIPNFGDDVAVKEALKERTFFEYIVQIFKTWQSRLMGLFSTLLINAPLDLWRLLDSIAMTVIAECVIQLTVPTGKRRYCFLLCMLILLIPSVVYNCSGWIMTTTTYVWPLALCLPTFVVMQRLLTGASVSLYGKIISIVLLVPALTELLLVPVVFCFSALILLYQMWKTKKERNVLVASLKEPHIGYLLVVLFLSAVALLFALANPGNNNRAVVEVRWFPEFPALSIFEKLKIGILITLPYYYAMDACISSTPVLHFNLIIMPLLLILILKFISEKKKVLVAMQLPGLLIVFSQFFQMFFAKNIFPIHIFDFLKNSYLPQFSLYSSALVCAEICLYVFVLFALIFSIFKAFEYKPQGIFVALIFLAGFCTRFILCLSPTCYASSVRTTYYMSIALCITTVFVFQTLHVSTEKLLKCAVGFVLFAYCFHYLSNLPNAYEKETKLPSYKVLQKSFPNSFDFDSEGNFSAWAYYENDECELYVRNGGKFYKAAERVYRGDVKEAFGLKSGNVGFSCRIKSSKNECYLYLMNKTKKEIYTTDPTLPAVLPDWNISERDFPCCLDVETDSVLAGWAYWENDDCEVYVKIGEKFYRAGKNEREDVKNAFSLERNDVGFYFSYFGKIEEFGLYLVNRSKREIYTLPR